MLNTLPVTCRGHDFLVTFDHEHTKADLSVGQPERVEIFIEAVTLAGHPDLDLTQLAVDFFHDELVQSLKHQHENKITQ